MIDCAIEVLLSLAIDLLIKVLALFSREHLQRRIGDTETAGSVQQQVHVEGLWIILSRSIQGFFCPFSLQGVWAGA